MHVYICGSGGVRMSAYVGAQGCMSLLFVLVPGPACLWAMGLAVPMSSPGSPLLAAMRLMRAAARAMLHRPLLAVMRLMHAAALAMLDKPICLLARLLGAVCTQLHNPLPAAAHACCCMRLALDP